MHDILELGAQQNISQLKGTVFRISHLGNVVVHFFSFSFEQKLGVSGSSMTDFLSIAVWK